MGEALSTIEIIRLFIRSSHLHAKKGARLQHRNSVRGGYRDCPPLTFFQHELLKNQEEDVGETEADCNGKGGECYG